MLTIESTVIITPDGPITVEVPRADVPSDIVPGEHRVLLMIEEVPTSHAERPPLDFPVDSYGSWPAHLSLRREDMYDDWGR